MLVDPAATIEAGLAGVMERYDSPEARAMLHAIGLQESRFAHRRQIGGPARGFWQFERGGVRGVVNHPASRQPVKALCAALGVPATANSIYGALATNDLLAVGIARLLLWTDPGPLPPIGDASGAWDYYLDLWRPGRPHPGAWPGLYAEACRAVRES